MAKYIWDFDSKQLITREEHSNKATIQKETFKQEETKQKQINRHNERLSQYKVSPDYKEQNPLLDAFQKTPSIDTLPPNKILDNPLLRAINIATDNVASGLTFGLKDLGENLIDKGFEKILPEDINAKRLANQEKYSYTPENTFEKGLATGSKIAGEFVTGGMALKAISPLAKRAATPIARVGKSAVETLGKSPTVVKKGAGIGAAVTGYEMGKGATYEDYADERDTFPSRVGSSLRHGTGQTISTVGSALEWMGKDNVAEKLKATGEAIGTGFEPEYQDFSWKSFFNPDWYANNVAATVPFTASLIPAMFAGYKIAGAGATRAGASPFMKAIISSLGGAGLSRPLESALEAGATYEEALAKGMSEEEADLAANEVFKKNMYLMGLDAAQLALAFAPSPIKATGSLGKSGINAARIGGSILTEAAEEGYQEAIQTIALGEKVDFSDPAFREAMAIGGLFGGVMGGAGTIVQTVQERSIERMSPEQKTIVKEAIEQNLEQGISEDEAIDRAFDYLVETPEGKELVETITQEVALELENEFSRQLISEQNQDIPIDVMPEMATPESIQEPIYPQVNLQELLTPKGESISSGLGIPQAPFIEPIIQQQETEEIQAEVENPTISDTIKSISEKEETIIKEAEKEPISKEQEAIERFTNKLVNEERKYAIEKESEQLFTKQEAVIRKSYEQLARNLIDAIKNKDFDTLTERLHSANPESLKLFREITGLTTKNNSDIKNSIKSLDESAYRAWENKIKEEYREKKELAAKEEQEEHISNRMVTYEGKPMSVKAMIDGLIDKGLEGGRLELREGKKGAIPVLELYTDANAEYFTEFINKHEKEYLKQRISEVGEVANKTEGRDKTIVEEQPIEETSNQLIVERVEQEPFAIRRNDRVRFLVGKEFSEGTVIGISRAKQEVMVKGDNNKDGTGIWLYKGHIYPLEEKVVGSSEEKLSTIIENVNKKNEPVAGWSDAEKVKGYETIAEQSFTKPVETNQELNIQDVIPENLDKLTLEQAVSNLSDEWTFKSKINNSGFAKHYQTTKVWEKNGRHRVYIPKDSREQAGYITLNENDVSGSNSGEYKGVYYDATRSSNVDVLKQFIDEVYIEVAKVNEKANITIADKAKEGKDIYLSDLTNELKQTLMKDKLLQSIIPNMDEQTAKKHIGENIKEVAKSMLEKYQDMANTGTLLSRFNEVLQDEVYINKTVELIYKKTKLQGNDVTKAEQSQKKPAANEETKKPTSITSPEEVILEQKPIEQKEVEADEAQEPTSETGGSSTRQVRSYGEGALEEVQTEDVSGAIEVGGIEQSTSSSPRVDEGENVSDKTSDNKTKSDTRERREQLHGEVAAGERSRDDSVGTSEGRNDTSTKRGRPSRTGNEPSRLGTSRQPAGINYVITEADAIGVGSAKVKYKDNVNAIKILKQIEAEDRMATSEEQAQLVKYVGWGGLPQVFDISLDGMARNKNWETEIYEVKELLTEEEWDAAKASTVNAHYTSPQIIRAIYDGLKHLGFEGGKILEPAVGIGNFFGLMPTEIMAKSSLVGIELDSISGRIAQQLYQTSDIRITGYEKAQLPEEYFDLVISNVPFSTFKPFDPVYNKDRLMIHDYYFVKSLEMVREGGLVAFITSQGTLDKADKRARLSIDEKADLIGAIRLPDNAFKENALTEVTTDLIILQKRKSGEKSKGTPFINLKDLAIKGDKVIQINEYFADNPKMLMGEMTSERDRYNKEKTKLISDGRNLENSIKTAFKKFSSKIYKKTQPKIETTAQEILQTIPAPDHVMEGAFTLQDDKLYRKENNKLVPHKAEGRTLARITGMMEIRDALREVFAAQFANVSDSELQKLQKKLNKVYDDFVKKQGNITDRVNVNAFSSDPDAGFIAALEKENPQTKKIEKTNIFNERTIAIQARAEKADSAKDALLITLNEYGELNFSRMEELTGKSKEDLLKELKGIVYKDPVVDDWVLADEYLSGNVRRKLIAAEEAAKDNPMYNDNVEALKEVQPKDLTFSQIDFRLGDPIIPTEIMEKFFNEHIFNVTEQIKLQYIPITGSWVISEQLGSFDSSIKNSARNREVWGTKDKGAFQDIIPAILNQRTLTVTRKTDDGKTTLDAKATQLAQDKQKQMVEEFQKWLKENPDISSYLVDYYNQNRNNEVPRKYDGSHLTLPGANPAITLRPHQKNGIWRIVQTGNTLMGWEVGAGKSFGMIAAGMERKRLGLSNKVLYVVPNHLVGQMEGEFRKLYPAAKLLILTSNNLPSQKPPRKKLESDASYNAKLKQAAISRKAMLTQIATENWDGIIISSNTFTRLPVSEELQHDFISQQINDLERAMLSVAEVEGKNSQVVKQLEKAKKDLEAKIEGKMSEIEREAIGLPFEQLGIDFMFVDEAQDFKNISFATKMTRVAGLNLSDSQRANDMLIKSQHLSRITNGKGVVFATGTPISNTMAEMFNIQRCLQETDLRNNNIIHFDSWASSFGAIVPSVELNSTASGLEIKNRFAQFVNVPELLRIWFKIADIKLQEDLNLPIPKKQGGKNITIASPPSPELKAYIQELAQRIERYKQDPKNNTKDNPLVITNDGRKASTDMRLVDPSLPDDPNSKINKAVNNVYDIWEDTKQDRLTQLLFLDLGTPNRNRKVKEGEEHLIDNSDEDAFNVSVYDDIKQKLIAMGVPENEIAFIHDAKTDKARTILYDNVREGNIRVLIGSTSKCGTGMNIQDKLVALHHIDAPWRPSDLNQREGRILRQGNINEEVKIFNYVTEGSFDARMWQILETKAKFIAQIMKGDLTIRRIEDIGDIVLSYGEVKAIASGDPMLMEKVKIDQEVMTLQLLLGAWQDKQLASQKDLRILKLKKIALEEGLEKIEVDAKRQINTSGDKFSITIKDLKTNKNKVYKNRTEAAKALSETLQNASKIARPERPNVDIGEFAGFKIAARFSMGSRFIILSGEYQYEVRVGYDVDPVKSLEASTRNIVNATKKSYNEALVAAKADVADIESELAKPFAREAELQELIAKQNEIDKALGITLEDEAEMYANLEEVEEEDALSEEEIISLEKYSIVYDEIIPQYQEHNQGEVQSPTRLEGINIDYVRDMPKDINIPNPEYVIHIFNLAKQLETPARYNNLKRALGKFTGQDIQVETVDNLVTLTHEVGHALDYKLNDNSYPSTIKGRFDTEFSEAELRQELNQVTKYMRPVKELTGRRKKHTELMADMYALYLLDPVKATELAPKVSELIQARLDSYTDIKNLVDETLSLRSFVENPAESLDMSPIKPIGEPRTLLPDDLVNPTEATKQLILKMKRTESHKMTGINQRYSEWTKKLSEEKREDIGAAVEKIQNLRTGKSYEQIMVELTPEEKNILAQYRYYQERERQEVNKFLQSVGEQEYIDYIEDYLNHQYIGNKKKKKQFVSKWIKNSPNAKKRVFPTLQEAVDAGFTPLTQDFAELHKMWGSMNWRVALNKAFVHELKNITTEEGVPVILKPSEAPGDWKIVNHPAIQKVYAKKHQDGTLELWHGGAAVHPDIYHVTKQVFQQPFTGNIVKSIENLNAYAKKMQLSLSLFHHWALTESSVAVLGKIPIIDTKVEGQVRHPLRGIFLVGTEVETLGTGYKIPGTNLNITFTYKSGMKLMDNSTFMRDITLTSGTVLQKSHDMQLDKFERLLRTAEAKTAGIPGLGYLTRKTRQANSWWDTALWQHYHSGLKAYVYYDLIREWITIAPETIGTNDLAEAKHKLGGLINDAFGGQEWARYSDQFWATPQGMQILHIALLAPDWTISNAKMGVRGASALYGTTKKTLTRKQDKAPIDAHLDKLTNRYWRNMMLFYFSTVAILNYALNDKWPWENESGHKIDVDVTNIMLQLPWVKDDGRRWYVKAGKQWREVVRYFMPDEGPFLLLGAKASPAVHQAVEQFAGKGLGKGWEMPWVAEELTGIQSIYARTKNLASSFIPFSLRGNQFAFAFPLGRGMSNWKATRAMEDIIKAQVDPTLYQQLMTEKIAEKKLTELVAGMSLNNLNAEDIWKQANSKVRTEYYNNMWKAIEKEDWKEADKAATALLKLGVEYKPLVQSGQTRGVEPSEIERASIVFFESAEKVGLEKLKDVKNKREAMSFIRKIRKEVEKYDLTDEEKREVNKRINDLTKETLIGSP